MLKQSGQLWSARQTNRQNRAEFKFLSSNPSRAAIQLHFLTVRLSIWDSSKKKKNKKRQGRRLKLTAFATCQLLTSKEEYSAKCWKGCRSWTPPPPFQFLVDQVIPSSQRALCVEMGFKWTFPRNQDATVKLKSNFSSFLIPLPTPSWSVPYKQFY